MPKHRLPSTHFTARIISLEDHSNGRHISRNLVKMSQNGEDTFMADAQGSQAGETEVADEIPLEKKLFLVRAGASSAS